MHEGHDLRIGHPDVPFLGVDRMKNRKFWIKNGFLNPKEGVVRLTAPTDWSGEYFSQARFVDPEYDALVEEMVSTLQNASNELGVTQPGYPAPVGNANEYIKEVLLKLEAFKGKK